MPASCCASPAPTDPGFERLDTPIDSSTTLCPWTRSGANLVQFVRLACGRRAIVENHRPATKSLLHAARHQMHIAKARPVAAHPMEAAAPALYGSL